jgi:hypothetical protein
LGVAVHGFCAQKSADAIIHSHPSPPEPRNRAALVQAGEDDSRRSARRRASLAMPPSRQCGLSHAVLHFESRLRMIQTLATCAGMASWRKGQPEALAKPLVVPEQIKNKLASH